MLVEEFYKINIQKLELRIEVAGLVAFVFGGCFNPPSGAGFQETPQTGATEPSFGPIVILAAANNVDGRQVLPYAGEGRRESAVADLWHFTKDTNWGHIKSKRIDPLRWMKGVHQIVVWCGTATQGSGAKIRGAKKRKGRYANFRSCGGEWND